VANFHLQPRAERRLREIIVATTTLLPVTVSDENSTTCLHMYTGSACLNLSFICLWYLL